MVRIPLSPEQRESGLQLGRLLRLARGNRPMPEIAAAADISVETLRKIETGRIPTPSFATVAAIAAAVAVPLDELAAVVLADPRAALTDVAWVATGAPPADFGMVRA